MSQSGLPTSRLVLRYTSVLFLLTRTSWLGRVEYSRIRVSREATVTSLARSRAFDWLRLESPDGSAKRVLGMPSALALTFMGRTKGAVPPGYARASTCAARFSGAIKARRNRAARVSTARREQRER